MALNTATIQQRLSSLRDRAPEQARAAFYSLPLLLLWILPFAIDAKAAPLRSGRRGFLTAMLCVFGVALVYALRSLFPGGGLQGLILDWLAFTLHSVIALSYIGISLWLAWGEWKGLPRQAPALDRMFQKVQSVIGR